MSALTKHLEAINIKAQAWVDEDPKNRFSGMVVTDPNHWAEYGIYTPSQYDRYVDENTLYELASTAYSKSYARSIDTASMSNDELQKAINEYSIQAEATMKQEAEEEAIRVKDFEGQILNTIKSGAGTRKRAIKWILQSQDLDKEKDTGYICYSLGLPYSFEKEFTEVLS